MSAFANPTDDAVPLYALTEEQWPNGAEAFTEAERSWATLQGFAGKQGQTALLTNGEGQLVKAIAGLGDAEQRRRGRFLFAAAASKLPEATYQLQTDNFTKGVCEEAALGWLLETYRFDRYKAQPRMKARLVAPQGVDAAALERLAAAEHHGRDLINTPAADMGPGEIEAAMRGLADAHGAEVQVIQGDALLEQNFPMIHAVGRAADRAPRLIDLRWGKVGPKLALVGKGVVFDTGGLNLKPAASMGLMKKDMGGAASMIALAQMIMQAGITCQLRLLIPAVENAIGAGAFRPGDVLTSRSGQTVEVNNTDAEGRLVLADALSLADEDKPDLIVSAATLTGAARVALGPDIPPFYASHAEDGAALQRHAFAALDPLWQMPFWPAYEAKIEPAIADLDNAPSGGMAGSITAALFLKRFVSNETRYLHLDVYGWQPQTQPARPKGGAVQGARALYAALPELLSL